jgi:hypothetical protein
MAEFLLLRVQVGAKVDFLSTLTASTVVGAMKANTFGPYFSRIRLRLMLDRFLKKNTQPEEKTTSQDSQKSLLDELAKNAEVLDQNKMNQVEGGQSNNSQFSVRYDWNSTMGGTTPL